MCLALASHAAPDIPLRGGARLASVSSDTASFSGGAAPTLGAYLPPSAAPAAGAASGAFSRRTPANSAPPPYTSGSVSAHRQLQGQQQHWQQRVSGAGGPFPPPLHHANSTGGMLQLPPGVPLSGNIGLQNSLVVERGGHSFTAPSTPPKLSSGGFFIPQAHEAQQQQQQQISPPSSPPTQDNAVAAAAAAVAHGGLGMAGLPGAAAAAQAAMAGSLTAAAGGGPRAGFGARKGNALGLAITVGSQMEGGCGEWWGGGGLGYGDGQGSLGDVHIPLGLQQIQPDDLVKVRKSEGGGVVREVVMEGLRVRKPVAA